MEFGIFLNGYIPGPGAHDTELGAPPAHARGGVRDLRRQAQLEVRLVRRAPLPDRVQPHVGPRGRDGLRRRPDRLHPPRAPASTACRRARSTRSATPSGPRCSTTSPNSRFEWGTGRGAGSHEMASFNILDKNSTKAEWEEVVREIPRMWEQVDYTYHGEHFTVPTPHNVLPKPYGKGHPPIWVACGNPPTFSTAGELGIGAIAFNFEPIYNLRGRIEAYKEGIANCTEPLGQFMNDNIMMTNGVICCEDREKAREIALDAGERLPRDDGEPVPRHDAEVARRHHVARRRPCRSTAATSRGDDPDALLDKLIEGGYMLVGNPEEVSEQLERYKSVGCDQLVFGLPSGPAPRRDPRTARAVRRQGHPRARQGPRALDRPLPGHGRSRSTARSPIRFPTSSGRPRSRSRPPSAAGELIRR